MKYKQLSYCLLLIRVLSFALSFEKEMRKLIFFDYNSRDFRLHLMFGLT